MDADIQLSERFVDAIKRVQKLRDEAEQERIDDDSYWETTATGQDTEEAEASGLLAGKVDAFDIVLDILQALAHGIEPAQGA